MDDHSGRDHVTIEDPDTRARVKMNDGTDFNHLADCICARCCAWLRAQFVRPAPLHETIRVDRKALFNIVCALVRFRWGNELFGYAVDRRANEEIKKIARVFQPTASQHADLLTKAKSVEDHLRRCDWNYPSQIVEYLITAVKDLTIDLAAAHETTERFVPLGSAPPDEPTPRLFDAVAMERIHQRANDIADLNERPADNTDEAAWLDGILIEAAISLGYVSIETNSESPRALAQ